MNRAIFRVDAEVIMDALKVHGVELLEVRQSHEGEFDLVVEHPSLPKVSTGSLLTPMRLNHRSTQCDYSCDLGHH